jgi:hypothetical protein
MLTPFPFAGIKGMKRLARKIENLYKEDTKYIQLFLTHIVRMQEEIGTGGGGFRFLYAAFLKEAMQYDIDNEILEKTSTLFVKSGDTLREFALLCVNGSRNLEKLNLEKISNKLQEALSYEEEAYLMLKKI